MTEKSTKQTILEIFIEKLGIGLEEITDTTTNNDLQMDSLDKIEIIMEIESEFSIEMSDSEMDSLKQFSHYVDMVERKMAG